MKKIIIPTDFSENAIVAGAAALKIAKIIQAEVEFIHCYSYLNSSFQNEFARELNADDALKEAQKEMEIYLNHLNFEDISYSTFFSPQNLLNTIENYQLNHHVDLIVMGTNGASGINYLLGSNSLEVAKKTKLPLIIVPIKSDIQQIKTIVFFTDFQVKDLPTLHKIENLFSHKDLTYEIVHFQSNDVFTVDENELRLENLVFDIRKKLKTEKIKGTLYQTEADLKNVSKVILEKNPDIISLSLIDRNFWDSLLEKSLAKQIILNPNKPIFILNQN